LALQPVLKELADARTPGGLELVYAYLDDLCLAGDAASVSAALSVLKERCTRIGLRLSTGSADGADKDKCEVILTAGEASTVDLGLFPNDFKVTRDRNFELLGGPIGSPSWCNQHTQKRVEKAVQVLQALGEVPDPQVALQLLRRCASFCKLLYSVRVVPSAFHAEALKGFDAQVRACFEQFTCLHPDDEQWSQAALPTNSGGLGLRSAAEHSSAAFLSSRTSCFQLCRELDPNHVFQSSDGVTPPPERIALNTYNNQVNDNDRVTPELTGKLSQKTLSAAIDKRQAQTITSQDTVPLARRAHLKLIGAPGAGLWLQAVPSKAASLDNDPCLYVTMLRRWLRMPFADADVECPCCDGILDTFGDHALCCSGGGDRTRRHNLIRNLSFHAATAANLNPELGMPGLLPQRPLCGGCYENGSSYSVDDSAPSARRPADVYIPRWRSGPPAAWDFAVTSSMRLDVMAESVTHCESALTKYEDSKCSHKDTKNMCLAQGITFIPMIIEAVGGGWCQTARGVWSELAKSTALATGELETTNTCAVMLLQRLSMTLHRENARACLKRCGS